MRTLRVTPISKPMEDDWDVRQQRLAEMVAKLPSDLKQDYETRLMLQRKEEADAHQKAFDAYTARKHPWLETNADLYECEMERDVAFGAYDAVISARQKGFVAAPMKPFWVGGFEFWLLYSDYAPFKAIKAAGRINVPLHIEGGSITVTFESTKIRRSDGDVDTWIEDRSPIAGVIDGEYVRGAMVRDCAEKSFATIQMARGVRQKHADRIAELMDYINANINLPQDLSVILAGSDKCFECGRKLDDAISKTLLVGPSCAKKIGVPHNAEMAQRISEARRDYQQRFACMEV